MASYSMQEKVLVLVLALAALFALWHVAINKIEVLDTETYVVQPGDTIWEIATKHAPDVLTDRVMCDIKEINNLHNYNIQIGQALELPIYNK